MTSRRRNGLFPGITRQVALLLLLCGLHAGWAADLVSGGFQRTITDVVDNINLPLPARSVAICNEGSKTVYVDFDGTGQAGPGRGTTHIIKAGQCKSIPFIAGRERRTMAAVTNSGETTTIVVDVAQE